jgi:hypothetical protein
VEDRKLKRNSIYLLTSVLVDNSLLMASVFNKVQVLEIWCMYINMGRKELPVTKRHIALNSSLSGIRSLNFIFFFTVCSAENGSMF